MNKNLLILVIVFCNTLLMKSQSPGGVSTGLQLWYDAGVAATNTTWTDRVNSFMLTKDGTAATVFSSGTTAGNFNPFYTFPNGTTDPTRYHFTGLLSGTLAPSSLGRPQTSFAVGSKAGNIDGTFNHIMRFGSGSGSGVTHFYGLGINTSSNNPYLHYFGINNFSTTVSLALNTPYIISSRTTNALGTFGIDIGHNGLYTSSSANITSDNFSNFQIGGSTFGFNGNVPEVIYYNISLTDSDRQRVNSYLAVKYGLTLDQSTAQNYLNSSAQVIWNATANSGFKNNIVGIGRDDGSGLIQKQSVSQETGLQPIISNGTASIAATNASNTSAFIANLSYLIAGSDTGSTLFSTPITGLSGVNNRLGRIWKVQKTGTVGTVTIAWPTTDTSVKLLVSNDAIFDSSDTAIATTTVTVNGVSYQRATVNLTDGQFFTFGAFINAPGGVNNGLQLWYDAGVTATSTTWTDRTNSFVLSKDGTATTVLSSGNVNSNFNPFYTFPNGNTDATRYHFTGLLSGSLAPSALGRLQTTFAVGSKASTIDGTFNHIMRFGNISGNNASHQFGLGINTSNNNPWLHYVSNGNFNSSTALSLNIPYIISSQVKTISGTNNIDVGHNGLYSAFSGSITVDNNANFQIGGSNFGFNGNVPEVIYYNSNLTTTERLKVNSYLAIKNGITLDQTTPTNYLNSSSQVIWNATTFAGFNKNIAGLLRDDFSGLNQKQSNSINQTDDQIIMSTSTGTLPATNQTNTTGIIGDLKSLVWGDNGVTTNGKTPFIDPVSSKNYVRSNRVWAVDNTNSYNQKTQILLPAADNLFGGVVQLMINTTSPTFASGTNIFISPTGMQTVFGKPYYAFDVPAANVSTDFFFTVAAIDSDADGFSDIDDLDADNDGILNAVESPSCYVNLSVWNTQAKTRLLVISSPFLTVSGVNNFVALGDNINASAVQFQTSPGQNQAGATIFNLDFGNPIQLDALYIRKTNTTSIFGGTVRLEGSIDGSSWIQLSSAVTTSGSFTTADGTISLTGEKLSVTQNAGLYQFYRIQGVGSGTLGAGIATEFYFDINNSAYIQSYFPETTCLEDIDGDGISNQLDLDSDGDGCPDATEGVSNFRAPTVVNSTMPGGNTGGSSYSGTSSLPVTQNLGTNSQTTLATAGIPTVAGTGQAIGFSQIATFNFCLDSDSDGVYDVDDLDDDNDGILDTAENGCLGIITNAVANGNFSAGNAGWTSNSANWVFTNGKVLYATVATNSILSQNINFSNFISAGASLLLSYSHEDREFGDGYTLEVSIGGTLYATITNPVGNALNTGTIVASNGATSNVSTFTSNGTTPIRLTIPLSGIPVSGNLAFRLVTQGINGDDLSIDNVSIINNCTGKDTDGDGIINSLDLDSDGDGCSDAIEGGAAFTIGNLVSSAMPGGNSNSSGNYTGTSTLPVIQNLCALNNCISTTPATLGIPIIAVAGQTVGDSQNGLVSTQCSTFCYKPGLLSGAALDAKQGITALGRAGASGDNWPMVRKGAWTVLEAKTKGFVINRLTTAQITAMANPVEGMMVYDTDADCIKVYTSTDNGATFSWNCFNTQTCPD